LKLKQADGDGMPGVDVAVLPGFCCPRIDASCARRLAIWASMAAICACALPGVGVVEGAFTVTVAFAVVVPVGFVAVNWYVVVTSGLTVVETLPSTFPIPLLILVELAFVTVHDNTEFCPTVIEDGVATKEETTGTTAVGAVTVATHVLVATVDEASVA
jgi:hypothetical protein